MFKKRKEKRKKRYIDTLIHRYLMLYVQSTVKTHIRAKQNILLPQVKIYLLVMTHCIVEDRSSLRENEVE